MHLHDLNLSPLKHHPNLQLATISLTFSVHIKKNKGQVKGQEEPEEENWSARLPSSDRRYIDRTLPSIGSLPLVTGSLPSCLVGRQTVLRIRAYPPWAFRSTFSVRVQRFVACHVVSFSPVLIQLVLRWPLMSEAFPQDPSLVQVQNNIRQAELLASQSYPDDLINSRPQEETLAFLQDRLKSLKKVVQVGLLERYIRICRKSSTNYPPLPITGIKACLYILKVSTDVTDTSIKEKLAIVLESWRLILEQEIGPTFAGSQSVWTCKALCQLTGRAEITAGPPIANSGKRKRSQDNLNGAHDISTPSASPLPQRCRTSTSRVPETVVSQDSPRDLPPNTLSDPKNTANEVAVCTNTPPSESNKPTSVQTPTIKQDLVTSSSNDPPKTVEPPLLQTSSSAAASRDQITPATSHPLAPSSTGSSSALPQSKVLTSQDLVISSSTDPSKIGELSLLPTSSSAATSHDQNTPVTSRPLASSSTGSSSAFPQSNDLPSEAVNHAIGPQESIKSQPPTASQNQISRLAQNNNQQVKTVTSAINHTIREHDDVSQTMLVPTGPPANPASSAQLKNWQHSFRRLDARITELLEIMPLTPVIPFNNTFYKPNPYSPGFQWTSPSLSSYVDPPGLSLTSIPLIVTFRPQLELHSLPTKSTSVTTPSSSTNLATSGIDSEKSLTVVSTFASAVQDSATRGKLPTPASPEVLSLPPARPRSAIEPTPSGPLACSKQGSSSMPPSLPQSKQLAENDPVEPQPIFNVTHAQKMKFVDTYRRVDASGKAKLEATLKKNKLWGVLAPLLTPAAIETPSSTTPPKSPPARPPHVNAAMTPPDSTIVQPSSSSTPKLHIASTAIQSKRALPNVSPNQHVASTTDSESSKSMPKPATPQSIKTAAHAAYINNAPPFRETSLDPVLSKMILAMLAAEPQGTSVLLAAFETLGIRNRDAIMTHLKSLAVCVNGKDNVWQLRTQSGPGSPSRVLPAPLLIASHPQLTPKPDDPIATPAPHAKDAPPPPANSLPNGTAEKSSSLAIDRPFHTPERLRSRLPRLSEPPIPRQAEQNLVTNGIKEQSGRKAVQSTKDINGASAECEEEIEVIRLVDLKNPNKATPMGTPVIEKDSSATKKETSVGGLESRNLACMANLETRRAAFNSRRGDTPVDERSLSMKKAPKKTQALKDTKDRRYLNILDDGLPGFPDVDPAIQIKGCPARILARYPADQQMPPIRTFVPLLKKAKP
ncbi:hypothetical protein PTTG_26464 [Puccinia triticina 1-1 BBBD Race 1]|uniref:Uncharacterized protein n=1 Tax=Puccinia triticina (isolate 1-1 / race 1 (BBBD)) TaxID=630390 RepID=A0A180GUC3_PUCT1|nr:hypothetical protein PTTG_26464 [Puccinia triticina 1-1 BBBD Race 1]